MGGTMDKINHDKDSEIKKQYSDYSDEEISELLNNPDTSQELVHVLTDILESRKAYQHMSEDNLQATDEEVQYNSESITPTPSDESGDAQVYTHQLKKITKLLTIICALFAVLIISFILVVTSNPDNTQWEYKVVEAKGLSLSPFYPSIINLNEGWELCSVVPITETVFPNFGDESYVTGIQANTRTTKMIFIYKRTR
jgi:hypothetical protein